MANTNRGGKKQIPVLEVCIDTQLINTQGVGASVLQMCESVGVQTVTRDQLTPYTVTWQLLHASETATPMADEMDEVLTIVPLTDFLAMVDSQVKKMKGESCNETLPQYVQHLKAVHAPKHLSVAVQGMDKYFSNQKLKAKHKHREEVTGQKSKGARKVQNDSEVSVTRVQVEETIVVTQLETGCCCRLLDSAFDVAELVKSYTKAVMEKPSKKDRLDCVFSFLEDGAAGVKADKSGAGLFKVWKLQLQQLHNLGPDMAEAITAKFPSPLALKEAYDEYPNPVEAWKVTENIVVRRGAGALETGRRVGQQLSRRIHAFMTSSDPHLIIK